MRNCFGIALLALCACLAACGDDDDDESVSYAYVLEGTHSGYSTVDFTYIDNPYVYASESLTLTATSSTTVSVSYTNDTWGTYEADDVTVSKSGSSYVLSGEGTASISGHSGSSTYDFTLSGTANSSGEITSMEFTMTFMGGTTITFVEGDAPAAYIIDGEYICDGVASFIYGSLSYEGDTVTVTAVSETTVDVTYTNEDWGEFSLSDLSVTENSDGSYSLSGEGEADLSSHSGSTSGYAYTFEATISSDCSDYTFTFDLPSVMSGTTITLTPAE